MEAPLYVVPSLYDGSLKHAILNWPQVEPQQVTYYIIKVILTYFLWIKDLSLSHYT